MPTTRQIETATTIEGTTVSCEQPTVYYDGSCPLCSTEISFYRKREGAQAITFVDVSDAEQLTNLGDLDSEQAMRRFHVRDVQLLYVLSVEDLASGLAEPDRVRWPGTPRATATLGSDL